MKTVVHNARARLQRIADEARDVALGGLKDVSDVKRDGRVNVRFRSTHERDALGAAEDFLDRALARGWDAGYDSENARVWIMVASVSL